MDCGGQRTQMLRIKMDLRSLLVIITMTYSDHHCQLYQRGQGNKKQSFYLTFSNYCLDRPFLNERTWL